MQTQRGFESWLFRELRSHKPCGAVNKQTNKLINRNLFFKGREHNTGLFTKDWTRFLKMKKRKSQYPGVSRGKWESLTHWPEGVRRSNSGEDSCMERASWKEFPPVKRISTSLVLSGLGTCLPAHPSGFPGVSAMLEGTPRVQQSGWNAHIDCHVRIRWIFLP